MEKKKFEGILICSDIDGTVFYHEPGLERGYVPENVCKAIRYFQDNGGRFTLATGRLPHFFTNNLSQYITPNAPAVTLNGAVIYDHEHDKILSEKPIHDDIMRLSYDVIERYPEMVRMCLQCDDGVSYNVKRHEDGGYVYRNEFNEDDTYRRIGSREEFWKTFKDVILFKMLYVFEEKDSDRAMGEITDAFPEYAVARSWIHGVELQRADADKGHGTRYLAELLGDVRLLVCVGNYENDISMIKMADIGYAVADAIDNVKAAADRVTKMTCGEGAIEEIIEDIEREFCNSEEKL